MFGFLVPRPQTDGEDEQEEVERAEDEQAEDEHEEDE